MLPPFIIEQIRRREQQERANREAQRPRVELPIGPARPKREPEYRDSGYRDSGYRDSGYRDSGYRESGYPASGAYDDDSASETPDRGVVIIQF